jgi:hypothetical protein
MRLNEIYEHSLRHVPATFSENPFPRNWIMFELSFIENEVVIYLYKAWSKSSVDDVTTTERVGMGKLW